jgi:hypothetical protein
MRGSSLGLSKRWAAMTAVAVLVVLFSGSAGVAQVSLSGISDPGMIQALPGSMGAAAPISGTDQAVQVGGAGVPLGTTELYAGGLSPAPLDPTSGSTCPGIPGVGTLGTGSIFDGNGTMSASINGLAPPISSMTVGCGPVAAGAGPLGSASAPGVASAFSGGSVPLGANQSGVTGLSGPIGVQPPRPSAVQ